MDTTDPWVANGDIRISNNVINGDVVNGTEVLDDKLLDSVTPLISALDDSEIVEDDVEVRPRTFCTRCRTISSSFLSEPSSGYNVIHADDCHSNGSQRINRSDYEVDNMSDDVPLLHDSEEDGVEGGLGSSAASDHCHYQRSGNRASRRAMSRLIIASCLTTLFMIAEMVGGYFANSIAIMSDAAHLLSDLTSFLVSLAAIYLALRPASKKMSFGYHRAEVLGALMSVLIIWVITGVLVYAAVERVISMDFEVDADTMIIISALGVVINIILGIVLHAGGGHGHSHGGFSNHGHSHSAQQNSANSSSDSPETANHPAKNINIRAAFIHVLGDLIQSIGVLIAAYIIRFYPEYKIADPICTFIFSVLVVFTTVPILKDLSHILMEGAPPGVDYGALTSNLSALSGVKMVHSLHLWSLTMDKNAASVHLAIDVNSDPEVVLREAQRVMRIRHHIFHTTIQVERYQAQLMDNCQQCQPLSK